MFLTCLAFSLAQADGRLTVMKVSYEDNSIFQQPCDIFAPCAKFKVRKRGY